MDCIEISKLISKQWANVNDIKKIAHCGRDKASFIRDSIRKSILDDGYLLPECKELLVPMDKLIKYLNINVDYIYSIAQKQASLKI